MNATTTVHPVDEKLPLPRLAALGVQHVLVMYAGAIAVPLIVGRALKLSPEQVAMLISAGISAVFRIHQRKIHSFDDRPEGGSKGKSRPRRERSHGTSDHVVIWEKPKERPSWMTEAEFASLMGLAKSGISDLVSLQKQTIA